MSFGEGVFASLRDITYRKIPNPWEHVCLHVPRKSVNGRIQGQVQCGSPRCEMTFSVTVVISLLKEKKYSETFFSEALNWEALRLI